jgi:hypothetical protein
MGGPMPLALTEPHDLHATGMNVRSRTKSPHFRVGTNGKSIEGLFREGMCIYALLVSMLIMRSRGVGNYDETS